MISFILYFKDENAIRNGKIYGTAQNFARELMELPSNLLTPCIFADRAKAELEPLGVTVSLYLPVGITIYRGLGEKAVTRIKRLRPTRKLRHSVVYKQIRSTTHRTRAAIMTHKLVQTSQSVSRLINLDISIQLSL